MKRYIRLCLLSLFLVCFACVGIYAKKNPLSGTIGPDSVRVILKSDTTFIDNPLIVKGTLIIEPGARIEFYDNSRIIVARGGRVIADGFATLAKHVRPASLGTATQVINAFTEGYHDMRCFLFPIGGGGTYSQMTAGLTQTAEMLVRERTIHPNKYNTIFNVGIDIANRRLVNIADPNDGSWPRIDTADRTGRYIRQNTFLPRAGHPNVYVVPYETAIMFLAARMNEFPATNDPLTLNDWKRADGQDVDVKPATITFVGQPQTSFSREWGHIVVLPGARTAFFRNCLFQNIKKDTTVDNVPFYESIADIAENLTAVELNELNKEMLNLTNGGGGAITTFSSRTWIVDCQFDKNFARLRGGALQILQTPTSFFYPNRTIIASDTMGCARFNFNNPDVVKNYRVSDEDKLTSTVMTRYEINYPRYPMIDRIDEPNPEDALFVNDIDRQAWDDARLAGYLGRFRNLDFTYNMVRLANVAAIPDGNGHTVVRDDTTAKVLYPYKWGNGVKGGAIYIAGTEDEGRQIEFTLGMNDSIRLGDFPASLYNPNNLVNTTGYKDYIKFVGNTAQNYQDNEYSEGAKGGAIYVGKNTSLIIAGQFIDNHTDAKWLVDTTGKGTYTDGKPTPYINGILYSQGGAIYANPDAYGRLQVRGDREKDSIRKRTSTFGAPTARIDNSTQFIHNRAGSGGAIFVEESPDVFMSPQIGGSDETRAFNNYGWKIRFANNYAYSAGGAIYTKRNMDVNGAGGARENYTYSLAHLTRFDSNSAGFSGGAIHVEVPLSKDYEIIPNTRIVNLRRVEFKDNDVNRLAFADPTHVNNEIYNQVRGGGAIYTLWADLNVVRGAHFVGNTVYNGNGGAIEMVNPHTTTERLFVTDLDIVHYAPIPVKYAHLEGLPRVADGYTSVNNPFTFGANSNDNQIKYVVSYPDEYAVINGRDSLILESGLVPNPNVAMLNRFEENSAIVDSVKGKDQIDNYGNTQISKGYIMPNVNNTAQFWTSEDNGFVAGNVGHLVNVYYQNSSWNWSAAFNDSLFHNHRFNDIYFSNAQTGYFSTNHGIILKTTDKGAHWTIIYQSNDLAESITDMSFIGGASDRAVAVTDEGRIMTTENGNTWNLASWNYMNKKFYGVHLINGTLAFVVGSNGTVVKMTNTGSGWDFDPIYVSGLNKDLYKVFFVNANKGFAIGEDGTFIKTADGGATWDIVIPYVFPRNDKLTDIAFVGSQIGYVTTSSGYVWKTTNGGDTWTRLAHNFGKSLNSLFLLDYDKVFVVGENDLVMRSLDGGDNWISLEPSNKAQNLGNPRTHAELPTLVENGIGLGGAIYILDNQNRDEKIVLDSIQFNRTRIVDNFAFTGSALYSDNYNLKLFFNRSLIRGNKCDTNNTIGMSQNHINGPLNRDPQFKERNYASSDLASATIYGEIQGPFPTSEFSTLSNSIFENEARFLIRLPDAPNTKGILAGQNSGIGTGGTDTLIGNYWGHTEAEVGLEIMNYQENHTGNPLVKDRFMTFFVEKRVNGQPLKADKNYLPFYNKWNNSTVYTPIDNRRQGPFEYNSNPFQFGARGITYQYIELKNADNTIPDFENIAGEMTIPEKYLFSYDVYDLHDKGTDIKTADYSKRRMFPIEDFAVGNPVQIFVDNNEFLDTNDKRTDPDKYEKYVKRWVRNPEFANAKKADGTFEYPAAARLQRTWAPLLANANATDIVPKYYHPLGMPIYLETKARTNIGDFMVTNRDFKHQGSTVFFIINETTQDFIRVDMKQIPRKYGVTDSLWADDIYRATIFLVPDSSERQNTQQRRLAENLFNLGSNGTYPFGTDPDAGSGGSGSPELLKKLSPRALTANEVNPGINTAAINEDYAALAGRKYSVVSDRYEFKPAQTYFRLGDDATTTRMVGLFSNRPTMPVDNDVVSTSKNETQTTFFAGERYGTLPANVGDVIRVVSRNVLWRQGITKAYDGGLVFIVKEGPEAPVFTGDITMWGTPELNPYVTDTNGLYPVYANRRVDENGNFTEDTVKHLDLLNKIFVHTNRDYPAVNGTYSNKNFPDNVRGTDFILTATAIDRNGFYDPRNELTTGQYTSLIWRWNFVDNNSGLERWLMADTLKGTTTINNVVYNGCLEFKGTPINPYIVPGGERFQVIARNYAPGIDMVDSLKATPGMENNIPWFYQIFPAYLNTPYYNQDVTGEEDMVARYLQQDTIGIHGNAAVSEELRVYVMDSLPRFIEYKPNGDATPTGKFRVKASNYHATAPHNEFIERNYDWSRFQAGTTLMGTAPKDNNPKYLVNFTDKLRFKMDLNTDDELEDLAADEATERPWDFRYGRTAYSFANVAISAKDTLVMDTLAGNLADANVTVSSLKPWWMQYKYFMKYDTFTVMDTTLMELQRRGQMNIRIDGADADSMLRRREVVGSLQYNTDTVMAIVANDGHGGSSTKFIDLYINFQPRFITDTLLKAVEGEEYNIKRDIVKSIRIFDANRDQRHRFQLIYDTTDVKLYNAYDRSFPDETPIDWTDIAPRTPHWLHINPESGVLYGVPTLITNMVDTLSKVTVLVEDEDGLIAIHNYVLKVDIGNCPPKFLVAPIVDCLVEKQQLEEDIIIFDRDLLRDGTNNKEQLTLSFFNVSGLVLEPSVIDGQLSNDTVKVKLKNENPDGLVIDRSLLENGRYPITIIVKDRQGAADTLKFNIRVSDSVTFLSQLKVTNSLGHAQILDWGTARSATTGDSLDKAPFPIGHLDENYCEIEIPPLANLDVFDARWSIPTINGTYRNIFPAARETGENGIEYRYKGTFQAGGVNSSSSSTNYPVTLTWKPASVPSATDAVKNPRKSKWTLIDGTTAGNYFSVNMSDIASRTISSDVAFSGPDANGNVTITILDNKISNFHIIHDWDGTGIGIDEDEYPTAILNVTPNPLNSGTDQAMISFNIAKTGNVSIEIFDVLGNKVANIANDFYSVGNHILGFNLIDFTGSKLTSGTYNIRLTSGMEVKTSTIVVAQ